MLTKPQSHSLLVADDSFLAVIDVQDAFLDKLPGSDRARLLNNIGWIIKLAQWNQIPLIVTAEEYPEQPLAAELIQALPAKTPIFNKMIFGLADQPDLFAAVEHTQRKTAVLVGLETDVCVTHSALGLLDKGYRVAAVIDAVGSPAPGQDIGLARMQNAGVIVVNMKSLFYEWLRTVEAIHLFHQELPEMRKLSGIVL